MSLLLEVVVGLAIFSASLLLIFSVFPTAQRSLTQAKDLAVANGIAREFMEREIHQAYGAIASDAPFPIPRQTTVNGVTSTTVFEVEIVVDEINTAPPDAYDRKRVVAAVRWSEGSGPTRIRREVSLETFAVR